MEHFTVDAIGIAGLPYLHSASLGLTKCDTKSSGKTFALFHSPEACTLYKVHHGLQYIEACRLYAGPPFYSKNVYLQGWVSSESWNQLSDAELQLHM